MWSNLAAIPESIASTPATSADAASASASSTPESAADLNEALKKCVGEVEHKSLRQMCGRLIKKACTVEEFHSHCTEVFEFKDNGMGLYRRLVLSLPDGDRRALLVSLVDEAVAKAAATPAAEPVEKTEEVAATVPTVDSKAAEESEAPAAATPSEPATPTNGKKRSRLC